MRDTTHLLGPAGALAVALTVVMPARAQTTPQPIYLQADGAPAPPAFEDPCRSSDACHDDGECTTRGDDCVIASDADCRSSERCDIDGLCSARDGRCVAASVDDCRSSQSCRDDGRCSLDVAKQRCDDGKERASTGVLVTGIVSLGVGAAAVIGGIVMMVAADVEPIDVGGFSNSTSTSHTRDEGLYTAGGVTAGLGAALLVGGAVMAGVGGRRVPREGETTMQMGIGPGTLFLAGSF